MMIDTDKACKPPIDASPHSKTLLPVLRRCHNASLPRPPFGPHRHWVRPDMAEGHAGGQESLIPFFIHAPDLLPSSTVIRLAPLPLRATERRHSPNSASQRSPIPKSFCGQSSNSDAPNNVLVQHALLDPEDYSPAEQARDFSTPVGFLRADVVAAMLRDNEKMIETHRRPCWKALYSIGQRDLACNPDSQPWCLAFEDWINHEHGRCSVRSEQFDRLVRGWKESGQFLSLLAGWRDEAYIIYGPKPLLDDQGLPGSNKAFWIERAATGLFSFLTFGAHLTAFVIKDNEYHFWVPRRSANKQTWPLFLDNTAAGGITAGESPTDTILREAHEEASLTRSLVEPRLIAGGLISYVHRNADGWVQPEIQYVYDLQLTSEIPQPCDGESMDFKLLTVKETLDSMLAGQWKANCAAVMLDFFVRHGLLSPESESKYFQICTELKQNVGLPGPY